MYKATNAIQRDELSEFLSEVTSGSEKPSAEFKKNLKEELLQRAQSPSVNFLKALFMSRSFFNQSLVTLGSLTVVLILAIGGYAGYQHFFKGPQDQHVLANFIANNRNGALASPETLQAGARAVTASDQAEKMQSFMPYQEHAYEHSKSIYTIGRAVSQCDVSAWMKDYGSDEYWKYYDIETGSMQSKSISYDKSGTLTNYWLQATDSSIAYIGGSYAVKEIGTSNMLYSDSSGAERIRDTATVKDPVATEIVSDEPEDVSIDDVERYFGPDVQVSGREKINGIWHYVIEQSYDISCGDNSTAQVKQITVFYADEVDFKPTRTEVYINSVSDQNLQYRVDVESESLDVSWADVADKFTFDFDVPIREYDISQEAADERTKQYLVENNTTLILPTSALLTAYSIDVPSLDQNTYYWNDRAFYPAGSKGTKMYEDATVWVRDPLLVTPEAGIMISNSSETEYLSFDIYTLQISTTQEDGRDSFFGPMAEGYYSATPSAISLTLDDNAVNTTLYEIDYQLGDATEPGIGYPSDGSKPSTGEGKSSSTSSPSAPDVDTEKQAGCGEIGGYCDDRFVSFESQGYRFFVIIRGNIATNNLPAYLQFKTVHGSDTTQIDDIFRRLSSTP